MTANCIQFESSASPRKSRRRRKQGTSATASQVVAHILERFLVPAGDFCSESGSEKYAIDFLVEIHAGHRTFKFRSAVPCVIGFEDGIWTHDLQSLGLSGYGRSHEESCSALASDIAACWDDIAQAPDRSLTADAQALKQRLKLAVKEVVHRTAT